jgi:predicted Zn-dependent peptidase
MKSDPYTLAMPREFVLENGLRIVTLSTPTLKSADAQVIFDTGARDDPEGEEGTAHFLEHMMFNGTYTRDKSPKGILPIIQQVMRWGGSFNPQTGWNKTEYSITDVLNCKTPKGEPREYLADALDLLLEVIQYPRIKQDDIERERSVIQAELATQVTARNTAICYSDLQAVVPEERAIHTIGTAESIDKIDAQKLRDFWRKHYTPSNATVFIQGQGSNEELLKMVTDRLTVLGASEDQGRIVPPSHRVPVFSPGESRIGVDSESQVVYQFTWDMASSRQGKLNIREEQNFRLMSSLISQYLINYMREQEGLVYNASCYMDTFGHAKIRIDSDKAPEKVLASLGRAMQDFLRMPNEELEQLFEHTKLAFCNKAIHSLDQVKGNTFRKASEVVQGENAYYIEDRLNALEETNLQDVHELAVRIFSKPFALGLAGSPKLLAEVPNKERIAEILNIPVNDKPVSGFLETEIMPYDPRHGETEPLPNPVNHGRGDSSIAIS